MGSQDIGRGSKGLGKGHGGLGGGLVGVGTMGMGGGIVRMGQGPMRTGWAWSNMHVGCNKGNLMTGKVFQIRGLFILCNLRPIT